MPKIFYDYYDKLFSGKNYQQEIDQAFKITKKFLKPKLKKILEIGCGTGNHTLELAKLNLPMVATDIDQEMVKRCRLKLKQAGVTNVKLFGKKVEDLRLKNFQLVFSLFNVVTYIGDYRELISFFRSIYLSLDKGGVFLFDCWNGLAALLDPPKNKNTHYHFGNEQIICRLVSQTDFFKQTTKLNYHFSITNKKTKKQISSLYFLNQYLWTPNQIKDALKLAGFIKYNCYKNFDLKTPATAEHWKIMFVCIK